MKNKHILNTIGMILVLLCSCGCSSIFIPSNKPIISDVKTENVTNIQNFIQLGSGNLMDISNDKNTLLIFSVSDTLPVTHTIKLYKTDTPKGSMESFLSSEKKLYHGVFSEDGKGIFYTEEAFSENGSICQLVWTSLDKTSTKVLSDSNEDIITNLCSLPKGEVLYSNNHNQIVQVNADRKKSITEIDENYTLSDVKYNPNNGEILFLASYKNENTQNLYVINRKDNQISLPVPIDQNIIKFHINPVNGDVYYLKRGNENNKLCVYNTDTKVKRTLLSDYFMDFCIDSKGKNMAIAKDCDGAGSGNYQSISFLDLSDKKRYQLTAPKILSGSFFLCNQSLYYTVKDDTENPNVYAIQWQ